ncbi:retrovirus-related pol polyprotein from transposon TNT 1-94 [Tanacetum coccineum]
MKGKSMETKFEKSSVIRQPNAFKSQRQSILGKPAIFLDSLAKKDFSKSKPVTTQNVSNDFSKPVTAQILPQNMLPIVKNTNVIAPGMTRQPMAVPIRTSKPKKNVNQSVATSSKKTVATDSTVKKSRNITRKLYEQASKTCSWWYPKYTPPGYNWKPKSQKGNVEGLNHNLFSVGQFCDADLEVAFQKSTCYIRDLKGNDLLTGTEFLNKTLHAYFAKEGIRHETSTARTPEQNGIVERRNRTLVEAARTMLSAAKVPLFFWAEAIATACFTQNRSHLTTSNELELLYSPMFSELLNGNSPVVSKSSAIHAADNPDKRQQHNTTHNSLTTDVADPPPLNIHSTHQTLTQVPTVKQGETSSRHVDSSNMHTFYQHHPSAQRWTKDHPLEQVIGNPSQSVRTRRQLETDGEMCMFALTMSRTEPKNIKESMADSAWIESMQEELHYLNDKMDMLEKEGIDFKESFAPVARLNCTAVHCVCCTQIIYMYKWTLNSISLRTSEGRSVRKPTNGLLPISSDKVLPSLKKLLYGLKQAPRACYDELSNFLVSEGFSKAKPTENNSLRLNRSFGTLKTPLTWVSADHPKKQDGTSLSSAEASNVLFICVCAQVL